MYAIGVILGVSLVAALCIYSLTTVKQLDRERANISRSLKCRYSDVIEARESVMHSIGYLLETFDTVDVEINIGGNGQPPFIKLTGVEKVERDEP